MEEKFYTPVQGAALFVNTGLERARIAVAYGTHARGLDAVAGKIVHHGRGARARKLPCRGKGRFGFTRIGMPPHHKVQVVLVHELQHSLKHLCAFGQQLYAAGLEHDV